VPEVPPDLSGDLSSRYRLAREIGVGGMARVYLARDLKHDRDVAVKVMREDVAAEVGVDRFLAEIRTTARLKHPHILPLFDSGSDGRLLYYVMPFIEGESLAARIRRAGPLPIVNAIAILRQIADALGYAHGAGIVHRDLKPANVMIAGDYAFLMDFGVARAFAVNDPGATVTLTARAIGTPGYMAPEQVVGGAVGPRTDIYAFGVLAYEVLTGTLPFRGSAQEMAQGHIARAADPVTVARPDTPLQLAALIARCLEKAPDRRPQQASALLQALEVSVVPRQTTAAAGRHTSWRVRALAVAAIVAVVASTTWYVRRSTGSPGNAFSVGRLSHLTTDPGLELDPAISPDGRLIAYAAGAPGATRIFVRELAGGRALPLTEAALESQRWPQWSPDGSQILFQAGGSLSRTHLITATPAEIYIATPLSGDARKLAVPADGAISPSWSPDGTSVVFAAPGGIYSMPVAGSAAPRRLVAGADLHSPRWSPDATMIAYVAGASLFTFGDENIGNVSGGTLKILVVATGQIVSITDSDTLNTNPVWMPGSRTVAFVSSRGGGHDVYALAVTDDGEPVGAPVRLTSGVSAHGIALSRDGRQLLYSSYAPSANIWSVRVPAVGSVSVAEAEQITFGNEKIEKLAVSPDGLWLAYDSDVNGPADVWKVPAAGGRAEQVTHGPLHKFVNGWSPDGKELLYHQMQQDGQRDLFIVSADGSHSEQGTSGPEQEQHAGWGPNGNAIVFDSAAPGSTGSHAMIVTRERRGAAWSAPRLLTNDVTSDPKWSPLGDLIAFCASGQLRVIAPDGTGERVVVEPRGADDLQPEYPIWSPDGKTIYYKAYDRERRSAIWAVPAAGGTPRLLVRFDVPTRRSLRREFATDGRRFYFTIAHDESDLWAIELERK